MKIYNEKFPLYDCYFEYCYALKLVLKYLKWTSNNKKKKLTKIKHKNFGV